MILVIMFDKDVDIIDVPQAVVDNRHMLKKRFIRWIYSKNNQTSKKLYTDINGNKFYGVQYRSDSFVDWLNQKVLYNSDEQATVLRQQVSDYPNDAPVLFF